MRILIVSRSLGLLFGGGAAFDSKAARYLGMKGHEVKLLTAKPLFGPPKNIFPDLDVDYVSSPTIRPWAYAAEKLNPRFAAVFYYLDLWFFGRAVLRWLGKQERHRQFDVVQVCSAVGLAGAILKRWAIPAVAWLPGIPSRRVRRKIISLIDAPGFRLYSHGDPVRFVKERMGIEAIEAIGPGLELERIAESASGEGSVRSRMGVPRDAVLGVTVARLVPVKNLDLLLEALARAVDKIPRLRHLVVGDGPMYGAWKEKARSLGLADTVCFLGHQDHSDVYSLLAECDFFALSSKYENFSIAALEAMAQGLPVIGPEVGYLQDLIRDSGAGTMVPPGDAAALADSICRIVSDQELRERLSASGKRFVKQFDWPTIADELVSIYEKAGEARRNG